MTGDRLFSRTYSRPMIREGRHLIEVDVYGDPGFGAMRPVALNAFFITGSG